MSLQGMSLWGTPMLIVGRVGKIMAFAGSVVAVIDIIGPVRIRHWGSRGKRLDIFHLMGQAMEHKAVTFVVVAGSAVNGLAFSLEIGCGGSGFGCVG